MPASTPRLTIGIPVYNGERYLGCALDSVLAQDIDGLDVVVSDNASTDGTQELVRERRRRDPRVRYIRQEVNRGGVWNTNFVLSQARAPLFKWAFYDDVLRPGYLSACLALLDDAGPGVVGAHTRVVVIDQDGRQIEERQDSRIGADAPTAHERIGAMYRKLAGQLQFGVFRTEVVQRSGGFVAAYGSEMRMLTRILIEGRMLQLEDQLLELRRHPAQYGATKLAEMSWYKHEGQRGWFAPVSWMTVEFLRAVGESEADAAERARCSATVVRDWSLRHLRGVASDLRDLPAILRLRRDGIRS
ncbi:glycosyltransferase family 2 protein [Gryllotalpicola ginsengisoli]|uniref:glycosyltransferase family 2 protein n=1 Tax=Gryllotalpicola ginsengisoli TaxID=444608 RepID=UPI0003B40AE6|nr:glycosyltransferase family 2 protein [Gryllotalpicola ginsengisoli]